MESMRSKDAKPTWFCKADLVSRISSIRAPPGESQIRYYASLTPPALVSSRSLGSASEPNPGEPIMATVLSPGTIGTMPGQTEGIQAALEPHRGKFQWDFAIILAIFHLGAIAALFEFRWTALAVCAILWLLTENVGIAVTYHRLLTHRGYVVPRWLEYTMAILGTMALQGSPIYWVAVHRLHHQYTDKPGDPHSPRDGKWWSHMGWILKGLPAQQQRHPRALRSGPDEAALLPLAQQVPLAACNPAGHCAFRLGRLALGALGDFFPRHPRHARHLAGQLRHSYVGIAALSKAMMTPATTGGWLC